MDNEVKCDKLINRFILRGRKFVEYACFRYGLFNTYVSGEIGVQFVDDFQYFVFVKSIKSLISIRTLLKIGNIEDVFIILRSSFEGYLASRHIYDSYDDSKLRDYIFVPQQIAARRVIYKAKKACRRDTNEPIEYKQINPADMKLGKDKKYFNDFYDFLCNYAHCNFSIIGSFTDENDLFTCEKAENRYMAKIMTLFVYVKLFESIVTVDGEDFLDLREQNECYNLVREATKFIYDKLGELEGDYECVGDELKKHMRKMFKNMRLSLKEEIGSVKKDFL